MAKELTSADLEEFEQWAGRWNNEPTPWSFDAIEEFLDQRSQWLRDHPALSRPNTKTYDALFRLTMRLREGRNIVCKPVPLPGYAMNTEGELESIDGTNSSFTRQHMETHKLIHSTTEELGRLAAYAPANATAFSLVHSLNLNQQQKEVLAAQKVNLEAFAQKALHGLRLASPWVGV